MDLYMALQAFGLIGTRSIMFSRGNAECYRNEAEVELAVFVQAAVKIHTDSQVVNSVS